MIWKDYGNWFVKFTPTDESVEVRDILCESMMHKRFWENLIVQEIKKLKWKHYVNYKSKDSEEKSESSSSYIKLGKWNRNSSSSSSDRDSESES